MQRKKLLLSILLIGVMAVAFSAGTYAWFFDDEVSTNNRFQTGTIDIIVTGDTTVAQDNGHDLLKPSQVGYLTKTVHNVGNNPADVWKRLQVMVLHDGPLNTKGLVEPETTETGNLFNSTDFDLEVDGKELIPYSETTPTDNTALAKVNFQWMYLGTLAPGKTMEVRQSFHLRADADGDTNWAQDDTMLFNEGFQGRQTTGGSRPSGNIYIDKP